MVEIIKIDPSDMPDRQTHVGIYTRPEYDAVRALKEGDAIKFPCSFRHHPKHCRSFLPIRQIFRDNGEGSFLRRGTTRMKAMQLRHKLGLADWKGKWVCKDGWVYVHRFHSESKDLGPDPRREPSNEATH